MSQVTALLQTVVSDEPPLGFTPAQVLAKARAVRRRHRRLRAGAAAVGTAGVVAVTLTAVGAAPSSRPARLSLQSLASLERAAATARTHRVVPARPGQNVDGISATGLPGLVEQAAGVGLVNVTVGVLPPTGTINLSAGIDVPGAPYLDVQVAPAHSTTTAVPGCAQLSDLTSGQGDGFYGPCTITRLADGSVLVVRSGQTLTGGVTMAQALLVTPDGASIFAENTNQTAAVTRLAWSNTDLKLFHVRGGFRVSPTVPAVVRPEPVLDAATMSALVQRLAAAGRG